MKKNLIILVLVLLVVNCATTTGPRSSETFKQDAVELKRQLNANPGDAAVLRDIGALCYENNYHSLALKYLVRAFKADMNDAKTNAYFGLILEALNKDALALRIYKRFARFPVGSMFRDVMEGRYYLLVKNRMQDDVRSRIAAAHGSRMQPDAVAVFPLEYKGRNREYASMGRGLSEMIITDLSTVPDLTLIERVRIQSMLDEMQLGESGIVDQSTAPQYGRVVSAGKMVHGSFNVRNGRELQIDVALWDVIKQRFPEFENKEESLKNFFVVEKAIVFDIIEAMDIELTPVQRDKIMRVPTKNLNAFLAYCKGLEKEDAGDYKGASRYYQKAVKLDPEFRGADARARTSSAIQLSSQPYQLRMAENRGTERPPGAPQSFGQDIVRDRYNKLSVNTRSNLVPGQDSRKSAEEAQKSGSEYFQELPLPPLPPPR